jgi:thiol-disulfide isomerase/thioredoxin
MIDRLLLIVAIAAVVALVWAGIRIWRAWKVRALAHEMPFAGIIPTGKPAVVGFSTPGCVECRTRQAPALAHLAAALGETVTVRTLAAPDYPHLVDRLGILTAPATVVLDAAGAVRFVNLGFTDAATLAVQVGNVERPAPQTRHDALAA